MHVSLDAGAHRFTVQVGGTRDVVAGEITPSAASRRSRKVFGVVATIGLGVLLPGAMLAGEWAITAITLGTIVAGWYATGWRVLGAEVRLVLTVDARSVTESWRMRTWPRTRGQRVAGAGRFVVSHGRATLLIGQDSRGKAVETSACVSTGCDERCARVHLAPGLLPKVVLPQDRDAALDLLRLIGLVVAGSISARDADDAA